MNLLLSIQYTTHFSRVIVRDRDSVLSAIESTNSRIRMCENISTLNKIDRIIAGDVKPFASYLAGNSYFGKVTFKFTRTDKKTEPIRVYELTVKVFSALGSTIEEHDERYKRVKASRLKAVEESGKRTNV